MTGPAPAVLPCRIEDGRAWTARDLDALAALHLQCLPDSLFSVVGKGATRCLYRYMARSGLEVFVVLRDASGAICGASVASLAPHTLLRRLVQGSPMALWLLVGVARLPWAGLFDQQPAPGPERPELMFLYVDQALRSGGAGRQLVLLTESAVRQRGPSELTVMTADDPANRALAFYRGLGYVREATVRKYGKAFALFRRTLA